jgi:MSHA biogenesis protein MshP
MSRSLHPLRSRQSGAALIAALFLLVVVAALGVFAFRTGVDQQQTVTLSLIEARAEAAALSGLEFGSNRARALGVGAGCQPSIIVPVGGPTMNPITVTLLCTPVTIAGGVGQIFDLTSTAKSGVYGRPDYVQRVQTKAVSNIGAGYW